MRVDRLLAVAVLLASISGGTTVAAPPEPLAALVAAADHVLIGIVADAPAGAAPATRALLVQEYFKSSTFSPRLILETAGADAGAAPGERLLVFLVERAAGTTAVLQGREGTFRLQDGVATQALTGRGVPLDDVRARIRALVKVPPPAYGGALLLERPVAALSLEADRIVTGRVATVESRLTAGRESIETRVTVHVAESLKGSGESEVVLSLAGGRVGDLTVVAGGIPNFWPGEQVLLFLSSRRPGLTVAGGWQGKYSLVAGRAVQPETGRSVAASALRARIAEVLAHPAARAGDPAPGVVEAPFTTYCMPWTPAQVPVIFHVNPENPGTGAPTGPAFARLAHEALGGWQDVPDVWVSAGIAGTATRPGTHHLDGWNDLAWADLGALGELVLAANFCTMAGGRRLESDTMVSNTWPVWSATAAAGTIDLLTVVSHEFGHALGLGHQYVDCDGSARTPLMCPSLGAGVRKALRADDRDGLMSLYARSGPPPGAPAELSVEASGVAATSLRWTTGTGALAYQVQRAAESCEGGFETVATVPATVSTYADDEYGTGLPARRYCYRVRARGLGGDSEPSVAVGVELPPYFQGGVYVAVGRSAAGGPAQLVTGAGPGGAPLVRTFEADGTPRSTGFLAYARGFPGGVRVAACDVDGDGRVEIVTGVGPGGGAHVRLLALGSSGIPTMELAGFFSYDPGFAGGVFVACGDVDGDGTPDIITGPDAGGAPHVRVFAVRPGVPGGVVPLLDFLAFDAGFTGGVRVAAAHAGGGRPDALVVAAGPGGGPHVRVLRWAGGRLEERAAFLAYAPWFTGGVHVAAGLTGIVTGPDAGGGPHVRVFTEHGVPVGPDFFPYAGAFQGGVRVAAGDLDGDGVDEVVTAAGPGGASHVRAFTTGGHTFGAGFLAY